MKGIALVSDNILSIHANICLASTKELHAFWNILAENFTPHNIKIQA